MQNGPHLTKLQTLSAVVACAALLLVIPHKIKGAQAQQNSPTPATVLAGLGTPMANSMTCGAGTASSSSTSFYDQRDISTGNSVWKCKLLADGVTYSWVAPFAAAVPSVLGATASIGGALLLLGTNVSGTATVTGATVGSNCVATRADGTLLPVGLVIDCAVGAANTATVRISALIAGTPTAGTYNVRVIN